MTVKYKPNIGHIDDCVKTAISLARTAGECVEFSFNDTVIFIHPTHEAQINTLYYEQRERDRALRSALARLEKPNG